jgi:bacteriocin-like protein
MNMAKVEKPEKTKKIPKKGSAQLTEAELKKVSGGVENPTIKRGPG